MQTWQPSIAPAAFKKTLCLASPANPWDTTSSSSGFRGRRMTRWRTAYHPRLWPCGWCSELCNELLLELWSYGNNSVGRSTCQSEKKNKTSIVAPQPCVPSWLIRFSNTNVLYFSNCFQRLTLAFVLNSKNKSTTWALPPLKSKGGSKT